MHPRQLKKLGLISLIGLSAWSAVAIRASALGARLYSPDYPSFGSKFMDFLYLSPEVSDLPLQILSLFLALCCIAGLLWMYRFINSQEDPEKLKTAVVYLFVLWVFDIGSLLYLILFLVQISSHWHSIQHPYWIFPIVRLVIFGGILPITLLRIQRQPKPTPEA